MLQNKGADHLERAGCKHYTSHCWVHHSPMQDFHLTSQQIAALRVLHKKQRVITNSLPFVSTSEKCRSNSARNVSKGLRFVSLAYASDSVFATQRLRLRSCLFCGTICLSSTFQQRCDETDFTCPYIFDSLFRHYNAYLRPNQYATTPTKRTLETRMDSTRRGN